MSRSQFQSRRFILRHAWLNLWDERMTTGRINQVAIHSPAHTEELGMCLTMQWKTSHCRRLRSDTIIIAQQLEAAWAFRLPSTIPPAQVVKASASTPQKGSKPLLPQHKRLIKSGDAPSRNLCWPRASYPDNVLNWYYYALHNSKPTITHGWSGCFKPSPSTVASWNPLHH